MQKTVLVTGASSGIGLETVRALFTEGYNVVATVRKDVDEDRLNQLYNKKIHIVKMDVTDEAAIAELPQVLKKRFNITQLDGLVNNAGVANAGPFKYMNFTEVQQTFQVNVLGLMRITQVLLPLLGAVPNSKHEGRIINISSVSGEGAMPFLSIYSASKFAVEGFSEGLRRELMLFKTKVIVVAPGSIKTPIWDKGFHSIRQRYQETEYDESFQLFIQMARNEEQNGLHPSDVSRDILHALSSETPKLRYSPVPRKIRNYYLTKLIPVSWMDTLTAKMLKLVP
ncbi:SDR family oxidoreductase [Pseudobdellovibrio exovorus]|uniref:Ketoreductase domain-containing protein n=1 Tax=Pseudobdellovibrio exovorus JSS TaxID=1184267 RepID=M4VEH5_9BACT|nr:SDR family oxidoreductase [Pseudobdellovibrio exovorus]AGH96436.1 hypothetical protein A11Q_2220 [Pseudobdellovibrio exovorus JSS]